MRTRCRSRVTEALMRAAFEGTLRGTVDLVIDPLVDMSLCADDRNRFPEPSAPKDWWLSCQTYAPLSSRGRDCRQSGLFVGE